MNAGPCRAAHIFKRQQGQGESEAPGPSELGRAQGSLSVDPDGASKICSESLAGNSTNKAVQSGKPRKPRKQRNQRSEKTKGDRETKGY